MTKFTEVSINGEVVPNTEIIDWWIDETFSEDANEFRLVLRPTAVNFLTSNLQNLQTVIIKDGYTTGAEVTRLNGYIRYFKDDPVKEILITGDDKLVEGTFDLINKVYVSASDSTAGIVSEIVKDLLDFAGLPYDSSSIQDSTAEQGGTYDEFVCKDADPLERAQHLADAIGWHLFYRSDTDLVYFQPKGFESNVNVIYAGGANNNVVGVPAWEFDGEDLFNKLKIEGALDLYEQPSQLFSPNGSDTEFVIDGKTAEIVKVEYDSAGGTSYTTQDGGKTGASTTFDYEHNKETNTIKFTSTPNLGTNSIRITPTVGEPTPVELDDAGSIAKYGKTITKKITFTDVTTVSDAEFRGQKILDAFKDEFAFVPVPMLPSVVEANNYRAGQLVDFVDSYNSKIGTKNVMIRKIRRFYPEKNLQVTVGEKEFKVLNSGYDDLIRLKRIEELLAGDQTNVSVLKRPEATIEVSVPEMDFTGYFLCDTFWTNHPVNGLTNQGKELESFETSALANWTGSGFTLSEVTSDVIHKTKMLGASWVASGSHSITTTQSFGDLSAYTGVSSGTPSQGTLGFWMVVNSRFDVSRIRLRIGTDAGNNAIYLTKVYNSSVNYDDISFDLYDGKNYILVDLTDPVLVQGTPDWTNVSDMIIAFDVDTDSGSLNVDFVSISKSNIIGSNATVPSFFQRMIEIEKRGFLLDGNDEFILDGDSNEIMVVSE